MEKITVIEIMKSEVCHNHKSNCSICPILKMCQDGRIEKLNQECKEKDDYCINIE